MHYIVNKVNRQVLQHTRNVVRDGWLGMRVHAACGHTAGIMVRSHAECRAHIGQTDRVRRSFLATPLNSLFDSS